MTIPTLSLSVLGIAPLEEAVYRLLLRLPGATAAELAERMGCPLAQVEALVQELERKGFATHAPEREPRLFAAPPDLAVEALLLLRQKELQLARLAIPGLQQEAQARVGGPLVEIIDADPAAQLQPYLQSHRGAQREVMCLVRPPFLVSSPDQIESVRAEARARGVRYRNIVDPETLHTPGWPKVLRQVIEVGEEVRLLPVPFKMIVSDRHSGLLPLKVDEPGGRMLLLRRSAVLDALCELFEYFWSRAAPLHFSADGRYAAGTAATLGGELEALIPLLAAGANDKSIADQLGISQRTLVRRIEGLYRALDARSRFQAGWLAALRYRDVAASPPG